MIDFNLFPFLHYTSLRDTYEKHGLRLYFNINDNTLIDTGKVNKLLLKGYIKKDKHFLIGEKKKMNEIYSIDTMKFLYISNDSITQICSYLSTQDMLKLSYSNKYLYKLLLNDKYNMKNHKFKLNYNIKSLHFMKYLSYKVINLSIEGNKMIDDSDFKYLKGIHALNMSRCNQNTITDNAFKNLKGIHTLDISYCNQNTITDETFKNLKGIHTLHMVFCNQNTITDEAFKNLKGINSLNVTGCDQNTITWDSNSFFDKIPNLSSLNITL